MKPKTIVIAGGLFSVFATRAIAFVIPLAFVRSATDVVADVLSPDDKWDVMLKVRNRGSTTDYKTQISLVRASRRLARQGAICHTQEMSSSPMAVTEPLW